MKVADDVCFRKQDVFDKEGYLVTNDFQRVQGFIADEKGNIVNKVFMLIGPGG